MSPNARPAHDNGSASLASSSLAAAEISSMPRATNAFVSATSSASNAQAIAPSASSSVDMKDDVDQSANPISQMSNSAGLVSEAVSTLARFNMPSANNLSMSAPLSSSSASSSSSTSSPSSLANSPAPMSIVHYLSSFLRDLSIVIDESELAGSTDSKHNQFLQSIRIRIEQAKNFVAVTEQALLEAAVWQDSGGSADEEGRADSAKRVRAARPSQKRSIYEISGSSSDEPGGSSTASSVYNPSVQRMKLDATTRGFIDARGRSSSSSLNEMMESSSGSPTDSAANSFNSSSDGTAQFSSSANIDLLATSTSPVESESEQMYPAVVMSCSNTAITILQVPVQRQYTMTRAESKRMRRHEKEELVNVSVRIMGTADRSHLYFVAKDVCQIVHLRKGSVAKAVHDFTRSEKARMPVLCHRSTGNSCTQVLTVLTIEGVRRLMNNSRQPTARSALAWIEQQALDIKNGVHVAASLVHSSPSRVTSPNSVAGGNDQAFTASSSSSAQSSSEDGIERSMSTPDPLATMSSALHQAQNRASASGRGSTLSHALRLSQSLKSEPAIVHQQLLLNQATAPTRAAAPPGLDPGSLTIMDYAAHLNAAARVASSQQSSATAHLQQQLQQQQQQLLAYASQALPHLNQQRQQAMNLNLFGLPDFQQAGAARNNDMSLYAAMEAPLANLHNANTANGTASNLASTTFGSTGTQPVASSPTLSYMSQSSLLANAQANALNLNLNNLNSLSQLPNGVLGNQLLGSHNSLAFSSSYPFTLANAGGSGVENTDSASSAGAPSFQSLSAGRNFLASSTPIAVNQGNPNVAQGGYLPFTPSLPSSRSFPNSIHAAQSSIGPHDFSILNSLFGGNPPAVYSYPPPLPPMQSPPPPSQ